MHTQRSNSQVLRRWGGTLALLGSFAATPALLAQSDTGRVTGMVADPTGALIPGATVTLTNTDNGKSETRTTGSGGEFSFPAEPRGHYRIESSMAGFAAQAQNFDLQVQQVQTVEFKLTAGATNTVIEVTDAAPVVNLTTSSTGEVIEGRQVVDLPLGQRNFTELATLTPGVTRGTYGSDASGIHQNVETMRYANDGGAALVVNGLRPQANNFLLDGTDNNESLVNTIVIFPSPDAIQEFRVTTAVAPAEFGRAGGGIVNASIKSGTNQIHGTVFGYFRDNVFDARSSSVYFSPKSKDPSFQRKQFGFAAGGPLWKDKLFLFGDYQALRQKQPQDSGFQTVATQLMRQGNFSELLGTQLTTLPDATLTGCASVTTVSGNVYPTTAAGQKLFNAGPDNGAIFDPTTCKQFGTASAPNVIPASRANKAGLSYLSAFDMPNRNGAVVNNYFVTRRNITNYNDFNVRLDYNLTHRDQLFVRYSYGQDNNTITSLFTKLPAGFASGDNVNHPRAGALGYTRAFTPNLVNEFRFGYNRPFYAYEPPFEGTPVSANLGIVNANRNALLGGGALIGGNNYEIAYTGDGGPYAVPQKTYQYADSVTWLHNNHAFKAGANIMRREVDFFQGNLAKGYFILGGTNYPGTGRFTGYEMTELLSGFPDYSIGAASTYFDTFSWETGYFVQDDWKVNPRLTLNLGVRYDLYTSPYEAHNNQANYDIPSGQLIVAGTNGTSRSQVNTDKNNFAPRLGFAYDVSGNGRTSLRGGYGAFYFVDRGGVGNQLSNNPGFNGVQQYTAAAGYRVTLTGQVAQNTNDSSAAQTALPLPVFGSAAITPALVANSSLISVNPHNQNSMVQQWNIQLQQQLDRFTSVTAAYVGNKSDHLMTWFNANAPQLGTGAKTYTNRQTISDGLAEGAGNYNGLQLSANRNQGKNLLLTLAYTWSHTMDNSNGAFSTGSSGSGNRFFIASNGVPQFGLNYGNSDQDIRHVFTGSLVYNLPFGHGQRWGNTAPRVVDEALGGWQINTIAVVTSGSPFDINTSGIGNIDNRADVISYQRVPRSRISGNAAGNVAFFTGTFAPPPMTVSGAYLRTGNVDRNQFFGPGYHVVNFGVFKDFALTERVRFQLRAQAYNLFNTPQFTNPDTDIHNGTALSNGTYTTGTNGGFGSISGLRAFSEREMEFAARINF